MFDGCGQAARRAVNVNVGHRAAAFVKDVFKVQTDAGGFADFVMRGQVQCSVWGVGSIRLRRQGRNRHTRRHPEAEYGNGKRNQQRIKPRLIAFQLQDGQRGKEKDDG